MGPPITRGGNHALWRQRSHKSGGIAVGFEDGQALALGSITTGRVPVGGEGGFIQHDRPAQFFAGNASAPGLADFDHIRPLLLAGITSFFMVKPNRRRVRHTVRGDASTRSLTPADVH